MNTLIYLFVRAKLGDTEYAILDTPMRPARYYFGPVRRDAFGAPNDWIGLDNATHRYHAAIDGALLAAGNNGLDTRPARAAVMASRSKAEIVADFIFAHSRADRTGVYLKAVRLLGEEVKDQWTTADVVDAILRAAKVVPRDPTDSHP